MKIYIKQNSRWQHFSWPKITTALLIAIFLPWSAFTSPYEATAGNTMASLPTDVEDALYRLDHNIYVKSAKDSDKDGIIDAFDAKKSVEMDLTYYIKAIKPYNDEYNLNLSIPQDRVAYYQRLNTVNVKKPANFGYLATYNDPVIKETVDKLTDLYAQNYENGNRYYLLNSILEIGRNIKYQNDTKISQTGDYWKFPVETLADKAGDCEDTALLLAALLKNAGFDVAIVDFRNHVGLGLAINRQLVEQIYGQDKSPDYFEKDGLRYYYIESTNMVDFNIGQVPQEFSQIKPDIYLVN